MGGSASHNSAGFGRISIKTRPSLYTPVHLASKPAFVDQPPARPPAATTRFLAGAAIVVLVVVAAALATGLVLKLRSEPIAAAGDTVMPMPALDREADRLSRSAFATHRGRT